MKGPGNVVPFKPRQKPRLLKVGNVLVSMDTVEILIDVGPEDPWEFDLMTEILRDWLRIQTQGEA